MDEPQELSSAQYWDNRYRDSRDGWDLGQAPTWLVEKASALQARKVLVVGCGRGHDAVAFAQAEHEVVGLDFSPRALTDANALYPSVPGLTFVQGDVFELGQGNLHAMAGAYDLIWEQTCLCAIDPKRRQDYFAAIERALAPRGQWHAVLWGHGEEGGPPFHLTPDIVQKIVPASFTRSGLTTIENKPGARKNQVIVEYST